MKYKRYQKYKDSGIEWIGEIPEHWEKNRLKYIFYFKKGKDSQKYTNEFVLNNTGQFPVFSGDTKDKGIIGKIDSYEYDIGEVIFVTTVGANAMYSKKISGKFSLSQNCAILVPKNHNTNVGYFLYLLQHIFLYEKGRISLVMQPSLRFQDLNQYYIVIPTSEEQERIRQFLDIQINQLDQFISKSQSQIKLLQEKRQALITNAVTKGLDPTVPMKDSGIEWIGKIPEHWEVRKLKFMTKKINSGITPRGGSAIYQKYGIPLLRSQNIHFDGLHLDNVAYINKEIHDEMKNSKIIENDVLLNITGASIGRCTIIPNKFGEGNVNQHVCIIRCLNMLDPYFLKHFLSSEIIQNLISSSQVGASREGLTFFEISNFLIPNPPKSEQKQISDFLDKQTTQFYDIISKSQSQINFLQEKRQALITATVTGKIDVRNGVAA